jgi:signal transduction histidine kinase
LLANLVHELSRPLGALAAANYALLNGAADEVSLRDELLRGIDIELRTLQRLVDDLARFYNQILGTLELDIKPTPLNDWLPTILAPWRESAQRKGLEWQASWPDDLPIAQIDPDRLGQALGNLLGNAIKYTPAGGTVSVKADLQDGAAWIQVTDTGIGIAPEDQPHIFEPFYRGQAKTRFPQGMGLGLTIARDLIVAHGGRLELETQPEKGSSFIVRLPLNQ